MQNVNRSKGATAPRRRLATAASRLLLVGATLAASAGCANEVGPAAGSWVEIIELQQAANAVDIESMPSFRSVDVRGDRLVFRFDGSSPLAAGQVVAGNTGVGYLRHIESITEMPDGSFEAMTRQATLPDYYEKMHVIFHYNPIEVAEPTVAELPGLATASLEGCEDTTPCEISGGRQWGDDTAGCSASYGGTLNMGPFIETDLSASFEFDHGIDVGWRGIDIEPDGYFVIDGEVRAGVRLSGTGSAQLGCDADFAALLGGGEAPEVTLATVMIGPIPISLSATPILNGSFEAAADVGEFSAEAGAEATAHVEFGIKDGDPHEEREFNFESFADVTTARAGALSAHGEIEAGLELRLQIGWDFDIGPADIDLGVVATAKLTGTLGADFVADAAGCSWSVEIPWSCDAQFGIGIDLAASAGPLDADWSWDYEWAPVNIASGSLASLGGALPWCGSSPSMCDEGGARCTDELLDNSVCDGLRGFQACSGGQYAHCTCTAGGWTDCTSCMDI